MPSLDPHPQQHPDIGVALNRLLSTVRWLEEDGVGGLHWHDWNNNVHLAQAVSQVRGIHTPQVHIQRIRQGEAADPRGSVTWAIGRVLSVNACVDITPDYFYVPVTQQRVDRALDMELARLTELVRSRTWPGAGARHD